MAPLCTGHIRPKSLSSEAARPQARARCVALALVRQARWGWRRSADVVGWSAAQCRARVGLVGPGAIEDLRTLAYERGVESGVGASRGAKANAPHLVFDASPCVRRSSRSSLRLLHGESAGLMAGRPPLVRAAHAPGMANGDPWVVVLREGRRWWWWPLLEAQSGGSMVAAWY